MVGGTRESLALSRRPTHTIWLEGQSPMTLSLSQSPWIPNKWKRLVESIVLLLLKHTSVFWVNDVESPLESKLSEFASLFSVTELCVC